MKIIDVDFVIVYKGTEINSSDLLESPTSIPVANPGIASAQITVFHGNRIGWRSL